MNARLPVFALATLLLACGSSDEETPASTTDAGVTETGSPDSDVTETGGADAADGADADPVEGGEGGEGGGDDADAASPFERRTYSGPLGLRDYWVYRPASASGDVPMVMVLHGCSQTASGFAELTGFNELAETESFVTVWPEQPSTANPLLCWNWFLDEHQQRDSGEAALLSAIADEVIAEGGIDESGVYAVGLSAGGAMSVVLGAVFPEKYAAVASVEGCPFKGTPCLNGPSSLTGDELAQLAYSAMGTNARALPVFVVQGDADTSVPPANGDLLVGQWLGVADLVDNGSLDQSIVREPASTSSETAPGGKTYDVLHYDGTAGELILRWTVHGLTHAWPGGASGMSFSDPEGPDAADAAWQFFKSHPMP